jgi:HlyD family secretion protein
MTSGRVVVTFALVVCLAAAAVFYSNWLVPETSPSTQVSAVSSRETVTALGLLEPEGKAIHVGAPAGARLDRLAEQITEGSVVARGDLLAYLDNYAEMLAARDLAAAELEEAKQRFQAETDFAQSAIAQATLKIQHAEEVLPLSIEAPRAEIRRFQVELETATKQLHRVERLTDTNATSQTEYENFHLLTKQAQEHLARAQAVLAQLELDRTIQLETAHQELRSAKASLARAQLSTRVDSLSNGLRLAEARLERTVIRAPISGEVLKVLTRPGERVSEEPILMMVDTRSMFATAEVYETDVQRVRPGQTAQIRSAAQSTFRPMRHWSCRSEGSTTSRTTPCLL